VKLDKRKRQVGLHCIFMVPYIMDNVIRFRFLVDL